MRTLLGLMREKRASVHNLAAVFHQVLELASQQLTILDPEIGEEEIIQAVAAELTRLGALSLSA